MGETGGTPKGGRGDEEEERKKCGEIQGARRNREQKEKAISARKLELCMLFLIQGAGGWKRIVLGICVSVLALMTHLSAICT